MSARQSTAETSSSNEQQQSGIDLSVLIGFYRQLLVDALEQTLVIDPSIAGLLGLIIQVTELKSHGVDRMFYLEPGALSQTQRSVVYLCSNDLPLMDIIAGELYIFRTQISHALYLYLNHEDLHNEWLDQIKASDTNKTTYTLLAVPKLGTLCTQALQDAGVYAALQIQSFPLELVPLERDLLSLEQPEAFKAIFEDGDYSSVYAMGKAIMTLQKAYGLIPRIIGKGDAAQRLADILLRLRKEVPDLAGTADRPARKAFRAGPIDSLVILDRTVDPITPLATQLTYEGLIDETIGIRNAHVEVDQNLVNPPPTALPSPSTALTQFAQPAKKKKIHLTSNDSLFHEIRDRNFATVGAALNRVAKRINADYEARHAAMAGSVPQMRAFVGRLGGLQAEHQAARLRMSSRHLEARLISSDTGLVDQIMQTTMSDEFNRALEIQQNTIAGLDLSSQESGIRDLINEEVPLRIILRLLCILCVVSNGLKPKVYEDLYKEILQTYGYAYLPLLISLAHLRFFYRASPAIKSSFSACRKSLRLIVDDVDEQNPDDIAYVYSGYAPLSIRLLQGVLGRNGTFLAWKSIEDVVKLIPGELVDVSQPVPEVNKHDSILHSQERGPVTLLCILGGCTYTEIAAVRWMNQQAKGGRRVVMLSTGIINGNSLLTSLMSSRLQSKAF